MKNRWISAILALMVTISSSSLLAYADDPAPPPGTDATNGGDMLEDDMMVDQNPVDSGSDVYIPPDSMDLSFGNGQYNIHLDKSAVLLGSAPAKVAKSYRIIGTQGGAYFFMTNTTAPVVIDTDIKSMLPLTSTSTISVVNGRLLDAPSITYVPTPPAGQPKKAVTYYPVVLNVPGITAGTSSNVTIDRDPAFSRKAASDGKLHFWLDPGNYTIAVSPTKQRSAAPYVYTANVGVNGVVSITEPVSTSFSGGTGTATDPYQLTNAVDFDALKSASPEILGKQFKLMNTVSLAPGWTGISNFTGTFDGSGQTIGMGTATAPLFTSIGATGTVKNFTVTGNLVGTDIAGITKQNQGTIQGITMQANINGSNGAGSGIAHTNYGTISGSVVSGVVAGADAAGVAGTNPGTITGTNVSGAITGTNRAAGITMENAGTISNVTVAGGVNAQVNAAGVANLNQKTITGATVSGSVSATRGDAGGIAGKNVSPGIITLSSVRGNVTATGGNAGGLTANNESGIIESSGSSGTITANMGDAGGIAGLNSGTLRSVYASGTVTANSAAAGGIVGTMKGGTLNSAYSLGRISGKNAGGIAGQLTGGEISATYATGQVASSSAGGGIVGYQVSGGNIRNNFALNTGITGTTGNTGRVVGATNVINNNAGNSSWYNMSLSSNDGSSAANSKNGVPIDYNKIYYAKTYSDAGFHTNWVLGNGYLPALAAATEQPARQSVPSYLQQLSGGSSSGGGSTGGGGGGGGDSTPSYSETFWEDMKDRIKDADSGDRIKFTTSRLDHMPTSVLRVLEGRNVTLEITHGKDRIIINGKRMYDIPKNRIFYTFGDLADLYEDQPASSSKPSSSSTASSKPVQPSTPLPPASTPPTTPPVGGGTTAPPPASVPAVSSSSSEASSSEEESSSEPVEVGWEDETEVDAEEVDEVPEPVAPKKPIWPLVVAGSVIVLALIGGGIAFYFGYYRKKE